MALYAVKHMASHRAARAVGSLATARIRYTADADHINPSCLNVAQNHGPSKLAVRSVAGFKSFPILEALSLPRPEQPSCSSLLVQLAVLLFLLCARPIFL